MIKINLVKNRVGDTVAVPGVATSSGGNEMRESVVKVAFILIFTVGLMVYESQNLHQLQAELQTLQAQSTELEAQKQAKLAEVEGVKDVEKQARELEDKLKILKLLSRLRLREVKTLDFVQSSIPEKVWLKTMVYEADKEKVDAGHFNFTGNAVATEDLTEFVKRLEDSAYLNEVIVVKNEEVQVANAKSTMRDFQFTAQVEVKP